MKIAVLTSSRADYSIYLPLLKLLKNDPFFDLQLIAFGTHLSEKFGRTVELIKKDGLEVAHCVETLTSFETPFDIAYSIGHVISVFAAFWKGKEYDIILALGDRYEMFAAVCATVPYGFTVAHIHGGETTLGAIDNVFRHSITLISKIHFTSAEPYKKRVAEITGSGENVFNVGALAMDNFCSLPLYNKEEFKEEYHINIDNPYILITIHPETVSYHKNEAYIDVFIEALKELKYQLIITMPNADTNGNLFRQKLLEFAELQSNVTCVESLGTIGYLSCMKHCEMVLGNSSSGYIEAGFFPKYVVNVGTRQKGRIITENIINCNFVKSEILQSVERVAGSKPLNPVTDYGNGNTALKIIEILKKQPC